MACLRVEPLVFVEEEAFLFLEGCRECEGHKVDLGAQGFANQTHVHSLLGSTPAYTCIYILHIYSVDTYKASATRHACTDAVLRRQCRRAWSAKLSKACQQVVYMHTYIERQLSTVASRARM